MCSARESTLAAGAGPSISLGQKPGSSTSTGSARCSAAPRASGTSGMLETNLSSN